MFLHNATDVHVLADRAEDELGVRLPDSIVSIFAFPGEIYAATMVRDRFKGLSFNLHVNILYYIMAAGCLMWVARVSPFPHSVTLSALELRPSPRPPANAYIASSDIHAMRDGTLHRAFNACNRF